MHDDQGEAEDDRLEIAVDVLQWLHEEAGSPKNGPVDEKKLEMQLYLSIATTYLLEYRRHLRDGNLRAEAIAKTANGEMKLC